MSIKQDNKKHGTNRLDYRYKNRISDIIIRRTMIQTML